MLNRVAQAPSLRIFKIKKSIYLNLNPRYPHHSSSLAMVRSILFDGGLVFLVVVVVDVVDETVGG